MQTNTCVQRVYLSSILTWAGVTLRGIATVTSQLLCLERGLVGVRVCAGGCCWGVCVYGEGGGAELSLNDPRGKLAAMPGGSLIMLTDVHLPFRGGLSGGGL